MTKGKPLGMVKKPDSSTFLSKSFVLPKEEGKPEEPPEPSEWEEYDEEEDNQK